MKYLILLLALVASAVQAQTYNTTPATDTAIITTLNSTDTCYTKWWNVSRREDAVVITLVDDTSSDGFASDSIGLELSYQLGYIVLDTGGNLDTLPDPDYVIIDTLLTADLGSENAGVMDSTMTVAHTVNGFDTSSIAGYACKITAYEHEFAPFIRYRYEGIGDNVSGGALKLISQHVQKDHNNAR